MTSISSQADELMAAAQLMQQLAEIESDGSVDILLLEEALKEAQLKVEEAKRELRAELEAFRDANPVLKGYRIIDKGQTGMRSRPATRSDKLTVKDVILHGLHENWLASDIISRIQAFFPDSKAGKNDIAWYKGQIKKGMYRETFNEQVEQGTITG
jgi:hypothetical protein